MRKSPLFLLCTFALLLAACGGGSSGGNPIPTGGPTATPAPTATPTPTPTPTPVPGSGQPLAGPRTDPKGDWGPPALAQDLDFPVQHNGYDGTGQTVAIVIDSDINPTDLTHFLSYFQIPTTARTITTRSVDGASGIVAASEPEAALDTETIAGLAPGANVIIYQVPNISVDQDLTDAYNAIITDKKAFIVNNSFGGCEGTGPFQEDPVIATAAADGITFTASGGDDGNQCDRSSHTVGPSWPASNQHVVGVGGTETDSPQGFPLTNNQVWNDQACGYQCGGGGGVSGVYPHPAYQTAGLLSACSAPSTGAACSSTFRNTPDISFPAEDVGVYEAGKWQAFVGTSWSAPIAAAMYAQLYQYCSANGGPIAGVTEPASIAYYVQAHAPADFIDVTLGNDQIATYTPFYAALSGFDDASGLGVPKGWPFVQTACPGHVPAAGLMAPRVSMSLERTSEFAQHTSAYTIDVTPRVTNISDMGVRGADEPTRIQLVMQPDGDVAAAERATVTALQTAGFTIVQRFANHLVVDAVGPSSAVEQFFRTRMHNVMQGAYGVRYLPTTQIVVPASIAPYVSRISLDNVARRREGPIPRL